jgi:type I site-specific restriction endonuclease
LMTSLEQQMQKGINEIKTLVEDRIKIVQFNVKKEIKSIRDEVEELKTSGVNNTSILQPTKSLSAPKPQPLGDSAFQQEVDEGRAHYKEVEAEISQTYDIVMKTVHQLDEDVNLFSINAERSPDTLLDLRNRFIQARREQQEICDNFINQLDLMENKVTDIKVPKIAKPSRGQQKELEGFNRLKTNVDDFKKHFNSLNSYLKTKLGLIEKKIPTDSDK